MKTSQISLQEINVFDQEHFIDILGSLFEGPSWIIAQAWYERPFHSRTQLYQTLCEIIYHAPVEQQVVLLQAHPDLVGRAAQAGTLTPESSQEQAAAGLNRLTPEEISTFRRLNQAYWNRFGFPFVICARENKKDSILAGFTTRLEHSRSQEIAIALGEVAKICSFRLNDLVAPDKIEES